MPTSKPRVYVDACVFVSVLMKEKTSPICLAVLNAAERKDIVLIASRFLPIEIGAYRGTMPGEKYADDLVHRFLDAVEVEWVEVDLIIARETRKLSWATKLRAGDAIHLATAVRMNADYFMTLDEGFPIGETFGTVQIVKPRIVWEPTLEDGEQPAA